MNVTVSFGYAGYQDAEYDVVIVSPFVPVRSIVQTADGGIRIGVDEPCNTRISSKDPLRLLIGAPPAFEADYANEIEEK